MKFAVQRFVVAAMLTLASVAAMQVGLVSPAQAAAWVRPLDIGTVGGGFNPPSHYGVDISVPRGTPIRAVHAGVVQTSRCGSPRCDIDGWSTYSGCGWYVGINHPDGTGTLYCHMNQQPLVSVGQSVSTGQVIGYVGTTGQSSGPHLHFQTHNGPSNNDGNTVNPVTFMSARGVNLNGGGSTPPPSGPPAGTYWVDTFANAPGRSTPGGTQTGTLYAGLNYVYCRVMGPSVTIGGATNYWWLKTDLDTGNPWQGQWVSAYYLSRWGDNVAKDNNGVDIPNC